MRISNFITINYKRGKQVFSKLIIYLQCAKQNAQMKGENGAYETVSIHPKFLEIG